MWAQEELEVVWEREESEEVLEPDNTREEQELVVNIQEVERVILDTELVQDRDIPRERVNTLELADYLEQEEVNTTQEEEDQDSKLDWEDILEA